MITRYPDTGGGSSDDSRVGGGEGGDLSDQERERVLTGFSVLLHGFNPASALGGSAEVDDASHEKGERKRMEKISQQVHIAQEMARKNTPPNR